MINDSFTSGEVRATFAELDAAGGGKIDVVELKYVACAPGENFPK